MNLYRFRLYYILTQLFVLLIMWLLLEDYTIISQVDYIRLYSYWNIASFGYLFYNELKLSSGLQPVLVIALVALQYVGVNGLNICDVLNEGDAIFFGSSNVTPYLAKAVWFLSLEHILVLSGYYLFDYWHRNKPLPLLGKQIVNTNIDYVNLALKCYAVVWVLRIIDLIIPLASLTSVLVGFANKGQMIVLTFLAFQLLRNYTAKVSRLYWSITLLEIFLVLNHGMKEEILNNLIPYCIYLIIGYKENFFPFSARLLAKLSLLGIITIFVVFPYVSIFRSISNKKQITWSEVEITEVISEYGDYILKKGDYANVDRADLSTEYFSSRAGSIGCNAWSIHYAENNPPVTKYFIYCLSVSIPRFIWPDKPPNIVGNMMYELATGHNNWEQKAFSNYQSGNSVSSVSIGFIGGAYFSLGLWAALLFPFIAGVYICWFWRMIMPLMYYNFFAVWSAYYLISMLMKDFESLVDGGVQFYIIGCVYVLLTCKIFPMRNLINNDIANKHI